MGTACLFLCCNHCCRTQTSGAIRGLPLSYTCPFCKEQIYLISRLRLFCVHVCLGTVCMQCHGGQKRVLEPLKMPPQVVVSHSVGAGNLIGVLWKSSPCLAMEPSLQPPLTHFTCIMYALSCQLEGFLPYSKTQSSRTSFSLSFLDMISLCNSSGCPRTHFVDQAGLELTEICLSMPLKC